MILLWRVTTRCNYSCGFCAYDRQLTIPRLSIDPAEAERVALLAAEVARDRGEDLLLSWLGGEPLLWPPFADVPVSKTMDDLKRLKEEIMPKVEAS